MAQAEQKYFDMDVEPILNTPRMREIQWENLKTSLRKFYEQVPFDRNRMEMRGRPSSGN